MEFKTHWVNTTDQERLYVKTWGNAQHPALILVHGYPDNQTVWEALIHYLIQDYYIVTYDVRGAGQSSIPRRIKAYALEQLSLDLESVADTILPNRAFHLIAHDWGSIQSWESVTDSRFKDKILSFVTMSGPCLDHAAFWMKKQFKGHKRQFAQQMLKSWYIMLFQLPLLAPTAWKVFQPEWWQQFIERLERTDDLPVNEAVQQDGQYGVNLYRANFLPRLLRPRQRFAICPVTAIVLQYDQFVSPALTDEAQQWSEQFTVLQVAANHWAILSRPKKIASLIRQHLQAFQA